MAKKIDREELIAAVNRCAELTDRQKGDLRQLLTETPKYGLVWEDTPEDAYEQLKTEIPVMHEDKDRAITNGTDYPNHVIIEGDNLLALEDLCYTHEGQIDVIYIDPPYNTGNKDFVYNDQFVEKENSFRHSKWLSFMERRLKLAFQLLSDNGIILISIDDNEVAQLKMLCDQIFGSQNFIDIFSWVKTETPANLSLKTKKAVEYIICYSKTRNSTKFKGLAKTSASNNGLMNQTNSVHELVFPANVVDTKLKDGIYHAGVYGTQSYRIELLEDTEVKSGFFVRPVRLVGKFKWGQANLDNEIKKGTAVSIKTKAFSPSYEKKEYEPEVPWNLINKSFGVDTNEQAGENLKNILGPNMFDFPKPVSLIKYIIGFVDTDVVLDFFAGSGTTMQATMELNKEDGGHRQCILVTNNENNICEEVTYPRNKKVIEGYDTPKGEHVEGLHDNNLRYFKIGRVPRQPGKRNREVLAADMVDMLRIKHDVYTQRDCVGSLPTNPPTTRYYEDRGRGLLILMEPSRIPAMVAAIRDMAIEHIDVYVYSEGTYAYADEFAEVAGKVSVYALPSPMLRTYHRIAPAMADAPIDEPERELTEEEVAETSDDYKNEEE